MSKKKKKRKSQRNKKMEPKKNPLKADEIEDKEEEKTKMKEKTKEEKEAQERESPEKLKEEKPEEAKKSEQEQEQEQEKKDQEAKKEEKSEQEGTQEEVKEVKEEEAQQEIVGKTDSLQEELKKVLGDKVLKWEVKCKQETLTIEKDHILEVLQVLKEAKNLEFSYLTDLTALDCLMMKGAPERFAMVYHLYSFQRNTWIRLKAYVSEKEPVVDSICSLWKKANWLEREVYDMFGIQFRNHPDLRRILMPDDFPAHPLRKDYPLQGRGERDNFPRVS